MIVPAAAAIRSLCVFTGSSHGRRPVFGEAAEAFGRLLAERDIGLVYGGGHVGLMGRVADACLGAGGRVVGVIPRSMVERELAHQGLDELHVVDTMHQRKALMAELANGFVAMPGGIGTLEELFEVWTWAQLGYHSKPVGLLNVDGYFDSLSAFIDEMVADRFLRPEYKRTLHVTDDPATLLAAFAAYRPPAAAKWAAVAKP